MKIACIFAQSHIHTPHMVSKKRSWGMKLKTTQAQCIQVHDLCKLFIQHVTTVFANCTE